VLVDAARDAAEVGTLMVEDDAGVGVPAVGEKRSQWVIVLFGAARDDRVHGVRSRSQNTSSGSGSGASSSDASVSSASLALKRGHAQLHQGHRQHVTV
jgi:hypothetical protein